MTRSVRLSIVAVATAAAVAAPIALRAVPVPHLRLKHSFPAADTTLAAAPKEVKLWFSEPPALPMSRVTITNAAGAAVTTGKLAAGKTAEDPVVAPITGAITAGKYTVEWKAASDDGHPVTGTFAFTVAK